MTRDKLQEMGWKVLPHPPYNPDLAQYDFCLFRSLKDALRGNKIANNEEIKKAVEKWILDQPEEYFAICLFTHWINLVYNRSHYILS